MDWGLYYLSNGLVSIHPQHWPDLTKYKLLIIQTARQYSGQAWLEYDLAFCKDAAATGLANWSKMNSDQYNLHLRSPTPLTHGNCFSHHPVQAPPHQQVKPAALWHHFVILGTRVGVSGPLVNVATGVSVSSLEESTPGSTAPFLRAQVSIPSHPLQLALRGRSEPAGSPVVHRQV